MFNLDDFLVRHTIDALSISIIKKGEIDRTILSEGLTAETMFSACSISKLLTVLVILVAYEEGKFDLDSSVNNYLKGWQLEDDTISLKHLMTHQSGIEDAEGSFDIYNPQVGKPLLMDLLIGKSNYAKKPVEIHAEPGTRFIYADGNALVLEKILEDSYEMPFRSIIDSKILKTLSLKNSVYVDFEELNHYDLRCGRTKEGTLIEACRNIYPYDSVAGLWTTVGDLSLLLMDILKAYHNDSPQLLKQNTIKEMLLPHGVVDFVGYGVFLDQFKGKDAFYVQGWGEGFQSYMIGIPQTKEGIVIMMNQNPGVEQMAGPIGEIVKLWTENRI